MAVSPSSPYSCSLSVIFSIPTRLNRFLVFILNSATPKYVVPFRHLQNYLRKLSKKISCSSSLNSPSPIPSSLFRFGAMERNLKEEEKGRGAPDAAAGDGALGKAGRIHRAFGHNGKRVPPGRARSTGPFHGPYHR